MYIWIGFVALRRRDDAQPEVQAGLALGIGVLDRYLDIAEKELAKGPYLCGNDLTRFPVREWPG